MPILIIGEIENKENDYYRLTHKNKYGSIWATKGNKK